MGTVTGKDARICIWAGAGAAKTHSLWGISDFSLTFDRGIVEQELVGETGNYYTFGSLSVEGSYTNCKFGASGNSDALDSIINGTMINVSGALNTSNLTWFFHSCQITGYDIAIGDADTISEASIDFTVMDAFRVTYLDSDGHIEDNGTS